MITEEQEKTDPNATPLTSSNNSRSCQILHQSGLGWDDVWGVRLYSTCSRQHRHLLWDNRCEQCNSKNLFVKLLRKRKKIERVLEKRIASLFSPTDPEIQTLSKMLKRFKTQVTELHRTPFPTRQQKEDDCLFLKRVMNFFRELFKSTSPKRLVLELTGTMRGVAAALPKTTWHESRKILEEFFGVPIPQPSVSLCQDEIEKVEKDLLLWVTPFLETLKAYGWYYSKLLAAYQPVHPIFARASSTSKRRLFSHTFRRIMGPRLKWLRLGIPIWENRQEKELLSSLDQSLGRVVNHFRHLLAQQEELLKRKQNLLNAYRLSIRKVIIQDFTLAYTKASQEKRNEMVRRVLTKPGIRPWWWRTLLPFWQPILMP